MEAEELLLKDVYETYVEYGLSIMDPISGERRLVWIGCTNRDRIEAMTQERHAPLSIAVTAVQRTVAVSRHTAIQFYPEQ